MRDNFNQVEEWLQAQGYELAMDSDEFLYSLALTDNDEKILSKIGLLNKTRERAHFIKLIVMASELKKRGHDMFQDDYSKIEYCKAFKRASIYQLKYLALHSKLGAARKSIALNALRLLRTTRRADGMTN
ncbi:MAG: hypothetical protein J4432_04460 [DPANN group archaeon]|nr:hypothetical protein [DPANN group archaeon]